MTMADIDHERLLVDAANAVRNGDTDPPPSLSDEEKKVWRAYVKEVKAIHAKGHEVDIPGDWV